MEGGKREEVFNIAWEGGGIDIYRTRNENREKFIYHSSQLVDFDEDDWNFAQMEFSTFEGAFEVIKSKKWYSVYPVKIHED